MDSTPNLKRTDPYDVLTARADEALALIYDHITRADEQPSQRKHDAEPHLSDPQIPVDTSRPSISRDRRALSVPIGFLLAAFISVAVIASLSFYRDATKSIIFRWVLQLIPMSSKLLEKPGLLEQPSPSTVQTAAAESAAPQPATLAQTTPQDAATTAAPVPPQLAQSLQAILRDLANVEQGIEQLKTSQAQMARDNAQMAEQFKAGQEQMASAIAKASGHDLLPKTSAPPARPIVTSTSKPVQTPQSLQGTMRPQAASQPRAQKP
jgi:hypothetical protein